jgi:hypothetical protein
MPIAGRLPFAWIYPIGEPGEAHPAGAGVRLGPVIAGDVHYISAACRSSWTADVVTNTTPDDVELFRAPASVTSSLPPPFWKADRLGPT